MKENSDPKEIQQRFQDGGVFYHEKVHSCLFAMWSHSSNLCKGTCSTGVLVKQILFRKTRFFLPFAPQTLGSTEFFMSLFNLESSVGPVKRWRWNVGSPLVGLCIAKRSSSCMLILLMRRGDGSPNMRARSSAARCQRSSQAFLVCFPRRLGQRADTWQLFVCVSVCLCGLCVCVRVCVSYHCYRIQRRLQVGELLTGSNGSNKNVPSQFCCSK